MGWCVEVAVRLYSAAQPGSGNAMGTKQGAASFRGYCSKTSLTSFARYTGSRTIGPCLYFLEKCHLLVKCDAAEACSLGRSKRTLATSHLKNTLCRWLNARTTWALSLTSPTLLLTPSTAAAMLAQITNLVKRKTYRKRKDKTACSMGKNEKPVPAQTCSTLASFSFGVTTIVLIFLFSS